MGLAEFTVAFREVFETALILGVMEAYLVESGRRNLTGRIWLGAGAAGLVSVLASGAFSETMGAWQGGKELFEGAAMLLAAILVSGLILSMLGQKNVRSGVHRQMEAHMAGSRAGGLASWGLALFAFFAVLREGMEIVLFFAGIRIASGQLEMGAALAGAAAALLLAWAFFKSLIRMDAGRVLRISAVLLILMAGGLVGTGVHELQEAGMVPELGGRAYDLNPPRAQDGTYPWLHQKGVLGAMLHTVLGFPFAPSWEQLLAQGAYLTGMGIFFKQVQEGRRRPATAATGAASAGA